VFRKLILAAAIVLSTIGVASSAEQGAATDLANTDEAAYEALADQVHAYAPINALAIPCHVEAIDMQTNLTMINKAKADVNGKVLLAKVDRQARADYARAADKAKFCKAFEHNAAARFVK
jgi:hypothetical protein